MSGWVDRLCECGHWGTEHSDGGPAHTGLTVCWHDSEYGEIKCKAQCREYMPVEEGA